MVRLVLTVGGVQRDFLAEAREARLNGKLPKGASLQAYAKMLRDQALRDAHRATQEANGVVDGDYLFM